MSIFEKEIAAGGSITRNAMDCGGNLFAVIICIPSQPAIINVRGLRPYTLQAVDEDGGLCELSSQLVPVKPLFCSLGEALNTAVFVLSARQVEVSDQLRLIVGKHVVALVGAMPFVGRAIQDVVHGPLAFAMRILDQVIVPKIAHARHDPA